MTEQNQSFGMVSRMAVSGFAPNAMRTAENWRVGFNSHTVFAAVLTGAGYYLGARIGFALTFQPHPVSVLWPPNSILLAALLLTPVRTWWFLLLAALPAHFAAELQSSVPPPMVLCWFISNCCEALIGAGTTRYFIDSPVRLDRLRKVAIFCLCAVLLGPIVSSFVDAGFVRLNNWGQVGYWEIWQIRATSNVLAAMTVTPTVLAWINGGISSIINATRWRHLEAGLLFLGLLTISFVVLDISWPNADAALLYALLPFLLWAAARFGLRGTSTAIMTVTFLAIWGAAHGHGPFSGKSTEENALSVQLLLIMLSFPLMFLAAVIDERGKAEERFVKAFGSSPDAMVISRLKDGHIIEMNERCEAFFGYRCEEAIGRTIFDLNVFTREADRDSLIAGTSAGRVLHNLELCLRTKTGELRQTLVSADTAAIGGELCLILSAHDITERKRVEEALRESEERYRAVVESQTDLVCRFLPDTTLTFVNEAYCRFFGRRRDELIGYKFTDLLPETARGPVLNHLRSLLANPRIETYEHEVVLPDGSIRWQHWADLAIAGSDGRVTEFQAVGQDITERKKAEAEVLRQRAELAHVARVSTMGALAGSLAHELNQPLTAILSNAQAGSRFLAGPTPNVPEVREVLQDIVQGTKRAGEVIRQLRTLVKKDQPKFERLDLNRVIQDVVRLLHSDTLIRKVQIALDLDSSLRFVQGDSVQMQQVMLNLILNAFDAMKEVPESERKVSVRTRQPDPGVVQIEVEDCGTGIPPELLGRLFEPFHSTKRDGLGLGLSISRSIVEAHGGRLWAVNNTDRGATFCFTVPVANEEKIGIDRGPGGAVQKA